VSVFGTGGLLIPTPVNPKLNKQMGKTVIGTQGPGDCQILAVAEPFSIANSL
jgi:hypothetical protein